jgi:hypothetical protein
VGADLAEGFVVFPLGVAFGPLENQDIKLFCFIWSTWGLELGAMLFAASEEQQTLEGKVMSEVALVLICSCVSIIKLYFRNPKASSSESWISMSLRTS